MLTEVLLQWVTPILTIANSKRNSRKKKIDDIFSYLLR